MAAEPTSPLAQWLGVLGLVQYAPAFAENDIDFAVLPSLSEQDLKDLGVASMGHRKRLLKAIADLGGAAVDHAVPHTAGAARVGEAGGAKPEASAERDAGERRQLTVLFCDMVGFTELASRLDPEQLQKVIGAYEDACAMCIARYDGYVFQRLGDGIVAFFGYPLAHEGEAERAIYAALAIVDALARLEVATVGRLAVRIGIATGVVVVSSPSKGAVGETLNLAARLQGVAPTGGVVVSEQVRRLAGGRFEWLNLGEQTLKGLPGRVTAYAVVGVSNAVSRFDAATQQGLTRIVGRDQEIELLLNRWHRSRSGEGQVVLLSGEPGIGKSRILAALCGRLEGYGAVTLRSQCSPYHVASALYPTIDHFERALKFVHDEEQSARLDRLEALVCGQYGLPAAEVVYFAALLSIPSETRYGRVQMSPQRFKSETLRCLVDLVEAAARVKPSLMIFEDAHWADPTSLELLDLLIDRVDRIPLLVVLTHRPEFQPRWASRGHVTALNLSKLTRAQSRSIVTELTHGKALPGTLLEEVISRTDGVPLYVEELTKSILESGELEDAGDHYEATCPARAVNIPASLRDSLMARLDRDPAVREIAQIGAVIGREFSDELIHAVAPMTYAEADQALAKLTESGLASRRGASPEATYAFKHALVQDAAYDSLLKSRRRQIHADIARVMESSALTKVGKPELLARHFGAAGMAREAIAYGLAAARQAAARSAYHEALAQVDAGEALLSDLPAGHERTLAQLRLQLQRAGALLATKAYSAPEAGSAWAAARALCDELGQDARETSAALFGSALFQFCSGEMRNAEVTARELLRRAREAEDPALLLMAHRMLGTLHFYRGALRDAADRLSDALSVYDPVRDREAVGLIGADQKASSLAYQSLVLHLSGQPRHALATSLEALRHAESTEHALGVAGITWFVVHLHVHRREPDRALQLARRAVALSEQHGFPLWHEICNFGAGVALTQLGQTQQGIELIDGWLTRSKAMGYRVIRGWSLAAAASARMAARQWDAAAALLDAAAQEVEATDERWFEAEIHRLAGDLALARDGLASAERAEACFGRALGVARAQGARMWELRTSVSQARLWQIQGRRADALGLLDPVYRSFSACDELVDMIEAKAVLDALAC